MYMAQFGCIHAAAIRKLTLVVSMFSSGVICAFSIIIVIWSIFDHDMQIFHYGNSEQKGDHVITFNAVCLGPKFNMEFENDIWLSNTSVAPGLVYSFKIDLSADKCERSTQPEDPASVEFPTTHPYRSVCADDISITVCSNLKFHCTLLKYF